MIGVRRLGGGWAGSGNRKRLASRIRQRARGPGAGLKIFSVDKYNYLLSRSSKNLYTNFIIFFPKSRIRVTFWTAPGSINVRFYKGFARDHTNPSFSTGFIRVFCIQKHPRFCRFVKIFRLRQLLIIFIRIFIKDFM